MQSVIWEIITLPSERTLRDYTHLIRAGIGLYSAVDEPLLKEIKGGLPCKSFFPLKSGLFIYFQRC